MLYKKCKNFLKNGLRKPSEKRAKRTKEDEADHLRQAQEEVLDYEKGDQKGVVCAKLKQFVDTTPINTKKPNPEGFK